MVGRSVPFSIVALLLAGPAAAQGEPAQPAPPPLQGQPQPPPAQPPPSQPQPVQPGPYRAPVQPYYYGPGPYQAPAPGQPAPPANGYRAPIYAQPRAPQMSQPPPAEGAREHDGFYLRLQLGPGYFFDKESRERDGQDPVVVSEAGGFATGFEFLAGGTVADGFVVGGTLAITRVANYEKTIGPDTAETADVIGLTLLGPFIDWYPDVSGGFHVYGLLALAGGSSRDTDWQRGGLAIGGGAGYDWWISDEWSIGVLGKVVLAALGEETETSDGRLVDGVVVPSLMFGGTYH